MSIVNEFTDILAAKASGFNVTFNAKTLIEWLVKCRIISYKTVLEFMCLYHYKKVLPTTRRKGCPNGDKASSIQYANMKTGVYQDRIKWVVKYQNERFDNTLFS